MIRRTIEISREPCHLAVRDEQLLILRRVREPQRLPAHPENLVGSVPLEDLGVIMVDERDTTYTHHTLAKLAEHQVALVVCGRDHLPCGMFIPFGIGSAVVDRIDTQLQASKPRCKRVWSALVTAKIRAQCWNLDHDPQVQQRLRVMLREMRSGDPANLEAQAAQRYWPVVFAGFPHIIHPFRRRPGDPSAKPPNNLLDYGYAAVRAAVCRAIVSAGLLPAIGIHHRRRDNPFCLADDLVEPLRPMVDATVQRLVEEGKLHLDQPTKAELLMLLTATFQVGSTSGPLYSALPRYIASFVRVLTGEDDRLLVPVQLSPSALSGENECI